MQKAAKTRDACDLCGLPLRFGALNAEAGGQSYCFCCQGCRQVFHMLWEASETKDPSGFPQTDLFQRCLAAGVIPASEAELAARCRTPQDGLAEALDSSQGKDGAPPQTLALQLAVSGMWCPACAWVIEETLRRRPGVCSPKCCFSTDRLFCRYDPLRCNPETIAAAVAQLGYETGAVHEADDARGRREFRRLAICAFLTVHVMMLSFALYFGFFKPYSADAVAKISIPVFLLASTVIFYGGRPIFRKASAGAVQGAFGMETLIAAGSLTAYAYSTFNLLQGSIHLYYDTAAMLITLVLLGKMLEAHAKRGVQADLAAFLSLKPAKVKICSEHFPEGRYADVRQLQAQDLFRVAADEIVAADGRIVQGRGAVDESTLTGESRPVEKRAGDFLHSGVRVVRGVLTVRAERVGSASTLDQMIRITEAALQQRTVFESRTDRMLQGFVPAILLTAFLTAVFWRWQGAPMDTAIIRAVTVMVISCPCALGIAIPLARVAGIALAGRSGVLLRAFSAFERAAETTALVFDKTGTVTEGRWRLLEVVPQYGFAVGIPVAFCGLLTPLIAVCAMLMSSMTVIGNTLLLLRRK